MEDIPIKTYKTKISKEKGAPPSKKHKKSSAVHSKSDYFAAPAAGGWPSRHDKTSAPANNDAVAEAEAESHGKKATPTIWDLSLTPPKWAPPPLVHGNCKASPAIAAALEVHASKELRKLRNALTALCVQRGMQAKVRKLTLERWRFSAKCEEDDAQASAAMSDSASGKKRKASSPMAPALHPLIPSKAPLAEAELAVELTRQGLLKSDALTAAAALTKASAAAAARLMQLQHATMSGRPMPPPPLALTFNRHTIDFVSGRAQIKLSRQAYAKLAHFHRTALPQEGAPKPPPPEEPDDEAAAKPSYDRESRAAELAIKDAKAAGGSDGAGDKLAAAGGREALHQRLFALLLRYKSLMGHGFQAAIGPPVWKVIGEKLGVGVEGFGSPLNAYLPAFGSAFPDVDGPFGSRGSFFSMRPKAGSFAANPPFVHNVMSATAEHIDKLLAEAAAAEPVGNHALSYTVFLPGWQEGAGYQSLSKSKFLRRRVLIAAADHGYCDGAAHQRQDPYRFSPYDTAIFVLQTDKASRRWPADDKFEAALRKAFAECTPSVTAVKRQHKQTKGAKRAAAPKDVYRFLPALLHVQRSAALRSAAFKWVVLVDDDAFVFVPRLLWILTRLDSSRPIYAGDFGSSGEATAAGIPHFACGGGGSVLSVAALRRMDVESCLTSYHARCMQSDWMIGGCARRYNVSELRELGCNTCDPRRLKETRERAAVRQRLREDRCFFMQNAEPFARELPLGRRSGAIVHGLDNAATWAFFRKHNASAASLQ